MRPSSYHERNRYVNKPVISQSTASLLPRARLINTSAAPFLRPTIRHNSSYGRTAQMPYYPPANIIHSRTHRSSYHHNRKTPNNSYHNHHHHRASHNHRNHHRRTHHKRDMHHRSSRHNKTTRSRSRSRNRLKTKKAQGNKHNKSLLDGRFTSRNESISNKDDVLKMKTESDEFATRYEASMIQYYEQIIMSKLNDYYNTKLTPRYMIENDEKFRNRMERIKGLNAYPFNGYFDRALDDNDDDTKQSHSTNKTTKKSVKIRNTNDNKHATKREKTPKKKDKNIFSSRGKSSMNYKFRAFKKSNQPNSFVENETNNTTDPNKVSIANTQKPTHTRLNTRYHHHGRNTHHHGRGTMHTHGHHHHHNIHVNDDDIYIDRNDQIDMNELINGLVYSKEYQDHRIGTLNTAQNDYSQYFVDTRRRPQNFIRELSHMDRLKEYPKLRKLMQSKNEALRKSSMQTPPFYINTDLKRFELASLRSKFDVILVDPPWQFYADRCPGAIDNLKRTPWSFAEMSELRIQDVAENPSFLFLWSGSGASLNEGRQLLKKWGYKRCEVIVWLKTNKKNQIQLSGDRLEEDYVLEKHDEHLRVPNEYEGTSYSESLFVRSYEHCLMGIRGQVRRSTDGHLIHANVDTDVIITESAPYGSSMKPNELYDIIERFCMGRKRLELFGCQHNLRPGWLTISNDEAIPKNSNFDALYYNSLFVQPNDRYVPSTNEIEALRPKSPIRNRGGGDSKNMKNKNNIANHHIKTNINATT